jgi:hypothetical protein
MKTYRVSGPFAFRSHVPGSSFEADPKDPVVVRAVTRGSITPADKAETPVADDLETVGLDDLTRDQLDALATDKGVDDPASLPNKDAVKAAIAEVESETSTTDENQEEGAAPSPDNHTSGDDAGDKEKK